jgi:ADP-ribosylglycohydrolase
MQHVRDALLGTLLGDSLGVPHEFKQAHAIPVAGQIDMVMPVHYRKTYAHMRISPMEPGRMMVARRSACSTH